MTLKELFSMNNIKSKLLVYRSLFIFLFALFCQYGHAQNVFNYVLVPGSTSILPVDEQMKFAIQWYSDDGTPHEGVNAFSGKQLPEWTVNGQPWTNQNPVNGKLSVDLTFEKATYTAPSKIPATNPVVIAVRFHASDASKEMITLICSVKIIDPGNKWYVSYTYSGSSFRSDKSVSEQRTYSNEITGAASMLINGTPPEKDGHVIINTSEGDSIVSFSSSGQWTEKILEISRDISGAIIEKTTRNHEGTPTKDKTGIEFEYDPSPDGAKGLAGAGLNYSGGGKEEFYSLDDNNRLVKKDENDGPFTTNILLGHDKDILKKTSRGFIIDYSEKKDTTYTDILGVVHKATSNVEYHVTITRKGNHRMTMNNLRPFQNYYAILPSFMCNTRSLRLASSSL